MIQGPLEAWEAYCEKCRAFRRVRRTDDYQQSTEMEHLAFLCISCQTVLLIFQRRRDPGERSMPRDIQSEEENSHE